MLTVPFIEPLRVAVYYNPKTDTWVARHIQRKVITLTGYIRRESIYGYGQTAATAVDDIKPKLPFNQVMKVLVKSQAGLLRWAESTIRN